jgi:type II secretory ATPase GspE/PulE/Tfp pilus assembly ATPase PilB-like protein
VLSVIEMMPPAIVPMSQSMGLMVTLGEGPAALLSIWKPIVSMVPFVAWMWIVSRSLDKHAARFFLARETWNNIHMGAGLLALVILMVIPLTGVLGFVVGFVASTLVLFGSVVAYIVATGKDERVPDAHRMTFGKLFNPAALPGAKKAKKSTGQVQSSLGIRGPDKQALPVPAAETPELEIRVAAEKILIDAFAARATLIELMAANKDQYGIAYTVDGVTSGAGTLAAAQAVGVMDMFKTVAKQDVADRRRRQTTDISIERGEEKARKVRVTSTGGQGGMRLSLLIDPEGQVRRTPEHLGMLDNQLEELKALVADPGGLVLLAGMPKNGRTSTMYTIAKMHDAYTSNVQTVELEVQDNLEGTRQNKWDAQAEGPDHATLLRSIIRRDPNVVAVSELVDQATAKELAKAESDRVRLYVSVRADNAVSAIQMWMKAVGDPEQAAKGLHGVVAQKLYRKLCTNCRVPYQPAPDMLKKLGLPADKVKQLFKKSGQVMVKDKQQTCPVCQGVGFLQQGAVWEVYRLTAEDRELIKAQDWNALKTELRKKPVPSLQSAAIRRVAEGLTSLEEITRVSGGDAPPAKPPAGPTGSAVAKSA